MANYEEDIKYEKEMTKLAKENPAKYLEIMDFQKETYELQRDEDKWTKQHDDELRSLGYSGINGCLNDIQNFEKGFSDLIKEAQEHGATSKDRIIESNKTLPDLNNSLKSIEKHTKEFIQNLKDGKATIYFDENPERNSQLQKEEITFQREALKSIQKMQVSLEKIIDNKHEKTQDKTQSKDVKKDNSISR